MDVMLDLETLGKRAGCVVLSIGAVPFSAETGDVHNTGFYADLQLTSQLDQGLAIDESTLLWWLEQADKPRLAQAKAARQHPGIVLDNFRDWYRAMKGVAIWANGATFDMPILEALYKAYGMDVPWKYIAARDVRTLFALSGNKLGDFGTVNSAKHDALGDALFQAREVCKCIQALKKVVGYGKQRIAEIASADARLAAEREDHTNRDFSSKVRDFETLLRRDPDEAPAQARDIPRNGQVDADEGEARQTFIREIDAERSAPAEDRSSADHEISHGGHGA